MRQKQVKQIKRQVAKAISVESTKRAEYEARTILDYLALVRQQKFTERFRQAWCIVWRIDPFKKK